MANAFTLVQLRYFAAVAERENMTEAAHRLSISQSALSTAIAQLAGVDVLTEIARRMVAGELAAQR